MERAELLINQALTADDVVCDSYDEEICEYLTMFSNGYIVSESCIEFWGDMDGAPWRIMLCKQD